MDFHEKWGVWPNTGGAVGPGLGLACREPGGRLGCGGGPPRRLSSRVARWSVERHAIMLPKRLASHGGPLGTGVPFWGPGAMPHAAFRVSVQLDLGFVRPHVDVDHPAFAHQLNE